MENRINNLEVYNTIFNLTEKKMKTLNANTDSFDEFSFADVKDDLQEVLDTSKISTEHLQD